MTSVRAETRSLTRPPPKNRPTGYLGEVLCTPPAPTGAIPSDRPEDLGWIARVSDRSLERHGQTRRGPRVAPDVADEASHLGDQEGDQ